MLICFANKLKKLVSERHLKILDKWEELITIKVNSSRELDVAEKEDVKQKLRLEILKASCNKWKYKTYDIVVRSVINRRFIDTISKIRRNRSRLKYENEYIIDKDENGYDYTSNVIVRNDVKDFLIIEQIKKFQERMVEGDLKGYFTLWEKSVMDIIIFLYDNNASMDSDTMMTCLGEDIKNTKEKNSFKNHYTRFKKKMCKYLEEVGI